LQNGFRIGESHYVEPSLNSVTGPAGMIRLEPKIMQVLVCLAAHAGQVVPKERLMRTVWPDTFVGDDVLTRSISELRRVFGDDVKESRFIQTIPKSGYRLIAGVSANAEQDFAPPGQDAHIETVPAVRGSARYEARRSWKRGAWVIGLAASVLVGLLIWGWMGSGTRVSPVTVVVPLQTVPLTSLPGQERAPTFSPDGNQIAFTWDGETGDEDIYIQLVGAGIPLRLTTSPASDRNPAWSPDGRYIAFVRVSQHESGIFIIPALGGPERRIASVKWENVWDMYGAGLSWSPDGKFLAVSDRSTPQDPASLFVLSVDRSEKRKLTSPPPGSARDLAPAISPDGQTVAFLRTTSGMVSDIYVVPFVGGEPRRLTFHEASLHRVAWAPNGRELVFASGINLSGGGTLWRVSASGGKPERLPIGGDNATYPTISGRANRLAYVNRSLDANIWRIEIGKSAPPVSSFTKLIASTRYEAGPQFSPDGRRIAFHSDRSGSIEIWVCDAAGLDLIQLTSLGRHSGTPRWSPDSRRIAFDSRPGKDSDIYVIDADGGAPRRLTTEPSDDVLPSWSNDGRWIYFASGRPGRWELWKMPAEGGQAVQLTKHGGFASVESRDGQFLYYAKGAYVKGLWRVPVNGGEEAPVLEFPEVGYWGYWALAEKGIYFVNTRRRPYALEFFDFETRRVVHVARFEKAPTAFDAGLAVSSDGRSILYVQEDQINSDIVLVENFR
jgi:Tol biopolymer transport system component/DNA-binding winged helix-turn-helix (wHTH) protein